MGIFSRLFGFEEPYEEFREGSTGSAGGTSPLPGVRPPRLPDVELTVDSALGIGPVYRSVEIISNMVSGMSWAAYKNGEKLKRQPLLVRDPGRDQAQPLTRVIWETTYSLVVWGNAYWRVSGSGATAAIEVLSGDPMHMSMVPTDDGKTYVYKYNRPDGKGSKTFAMSEIKHLKNMSKPGYLVGFGPIQACQSELLGMLRLRAYADNFFTTSGVPNGYLTTDLDLDPEQAQKLMDAWKAYIEKNNMGVLDNGTKYEYSHIDPAKAQFVEVQLAMVVNIARIFGIPAMHLLAELSGTSMTYTNLEQSTILFLQNTLQKYMTEIEQAISSILGPGIEVKFNEDDLLRMDHTTKWTVRQIQNDIGYSTGAQMRRDDGEEPLPNDERSQSDDEAA